jgi:hypothetical protein
MFSTSKDFEDMRIGGYNLKAPLNLNAEAFHMNHIIINYLLKQVYLMIF